MGKSEIAGQANFSGIRYSQCWEDADVLLAALELKQDDTCLSVASAGDNTLAMVGAGAKRVIAVDLSPAQIACLELRVAAYRHLGYHGLLELLGQIESVRRASLYARCRGDLSMTSQTFWDSNAELIENGFATSGKFERYLSLFRRYVLPLIHNRKRVERLFTLESVEERANYYHQEWNNRRWQWLCRWFFGSSTLGHLGRDPSFDQYAEESVWNSLQRRIPHALIELPPSANPYLQWILYGRYTTALPYALREENFSRIRDNLGALEIHCTGVEDVLATLPDSSIDACNLSDIFEYVSEQAYEESLHELQRVGAIGCRLVYWNLVTQRHRPHSMANSLQEHRQLAATLHQADKAFFYRDLVIEEVL